jgi:rhamnogalacturonan endolyase
LLGRSTPPTHDGEKSPLEQKSGVSALLTRAVVSSGTATSPISTILYIYWAVYDFPTDFPDGVAFKVGESDVGKDWNYVHWSSFGGYADSLRTEPYTKNVNNWTILWDMDTATYYNKKEATFTVQLAGAKTAAGNTDVYNASEPFANLPYTVAVNGHDLKPWVIP